MLNVLWACSVYEGFLKMSFRISLSSPPVPVERFLCNFMNEVPVPPKGQLRPSRLQTLTAFISPPGNTRVQFSIGGETLMLQRPAPNELPFASVSWLAFLYCLLLS